MDKYSESKILSIVKMPLHDQCQALNLPLILCDLDYQSNPEKVLCDTLIQKGYVGASCEGGAILTALKSACLDRLAELNTFGSRQDACSRFLEAQFVIHSNQLPSIILQIEKVHRRKLVNRFTEIYKYDLVRESYPGLSKKLISDLFKNVGNKNLASLASLLAENPYQYRNGWPDLTLINPESKLFFVEVKTTDKLHYNQVKLLMQVPSILPHPFLVIQVRKRHKTILPALSNFF